MCCSDYPGKPFQFLALKGRLNLAQGTALGRWVQRGTARTSPAAIAFPLHTRVVFGLAPVGGRHLGRPVPSVQQSVRCTLRGFI